MIPPRKQKSQISVEFMLLLAVAAMFFIIISSYVSIQIRSSNQEHSEMEIQQLGQSVQRKIFAASSMEEGFLMTFEIDDELNGKSYSLYLLSDNLYVEQDDIQKIFALPDVSGTISPGEITLTRTSSEVVIS